MPEGWEAALDRYNLVWVGAKDAGNEVHVARRVICALLAPLIAAQVVAIDPSRIFLSGFSGGGRVASMMMPLYPGRFAGALFICGANPLFVVSPEGVSGLDHRPLVFLTGTGDFNLEDTRLAVSTFQQAGLSRAELVVVEGLGHALPAGPDFEAAVGRFDSTL